MVLGKKFRSAIWPAALIVAVTSTAVGWAYGTRSIRGEAAASGVRSEREGPSIRADGVPPPVESAIGGVVLDATGAPAAGAQIALIRVWAQSASAASWAAPPILAEVSSTAEGRFEFHDVEPGSYRLTATRSDQTAASGVVALEPGRVANVELRLDAAGVLLSGHVTDSTGGVASQARVTAIAKLAFRAVCDDTGSYRLNVPGGEYLVTVEASGYAPLYDSMLVRHATTRDFRLVPGGRIAGHVVSARGETPLGGAEVVLQATGLVAGRMPAAVRTGADGAFWFEDVAAGSYRVLARQGRLVGTSVDMVRIGPLQQISDLRIELSPAAVISGRVHVAGRSDGIEGARVFLFPRELDPGSRATARTGPDGILSPGGDRQRRL